MVQIMTEENRRDLLRYFVLSDYRDGDYFLIEEYEELENIIKRNAKAKELEEARYKCILKKIGEEEYNELYNKYLNLVFKESKEKTRKI